MNKAEAAAYQRRWRRENLDKARAIQKRYREKRRDRRRAYREAHQEEISAYTKAYLHRWRQENPQKKVRYRARKRLLPHTLTAEQAEQLLAIGQTIYPNEELHLDHIVPVSKGGGTTRANIHAIPASLNLSKHDALPEKIYQQLALSPAGIPAERKEEEQ